MIPEIFTDQPVITTRHLKALSFGNDGLLREWLKKSLCPADIKRAVLVELERPAPRQPILQKLIIALQKAERREIEQKIAKHLSKKR